MKVVAAWCLSWIALSCGVVRQFGGGYCILAIFCAACASQHSDRDVQNQGDSVFSPVLADENLESICDVMGLIVRDTRPWSASGGWWWSMPSIDFGGPDRGYWFHVTSVCVSGETRGAGARTCVMWIDVSLADSVAHVFPVEGLQESQAVVLVAVGADCRLGYLGSRWSHDKREVVRERFGIIDLAADLGEVFPFPNPDAALAALYGQDGAGSSE